MEVLNGYKSSEDTTKDSIYEDIKEQSLTFEIQQIPNHKPQPFYKTIPFLKELCLVIFLQFFIFICFTFFIPKENALSFLKYIESVFIYEYTENLPMFLIIYFVFCFISISFVIPTISLCVILFTVVSRNIFFTWIVTLVNYLITEAFLFYFVKKYYKKKIFEYVAKFRYLNFYLVLSI